MSVPVTDSSPRTEITETIRTCVPGLEFHELAPSSHRIAVPEFGSGSDTATEATVDVPVPGTRAFLDAIAAVEVLFTTDRRAATAAFRPALELATDADWDLLDFMVECFTLYPRESALLRLRARWSAGDDLERERLVRLVPDTDPCLHSHADDAMAHLLETRAKANQTSVGDEFAKLHAQLAAAEMPRQSIRVWRNPLPRLTIPASRRVDASRLTPHQIRARVAARGKRRHAQPEPDVVTDYITEALFVDTEIDPHTRHARRIAELVARGVQFTGTTADASPARRRHAGTSKSAELAKAMWDHDYCAFVAAQHDYDRALAGERVKSHDDSLVWAERRTRLGARSDRREGFLFQGNGLDDFETAMENVRGWRCVSCFIERCHTDQRPIHARDGVLRSDDGLCAHCRADNATGLPALADEFTVEGLARTYCDYFVTHYRSAASALILEVRRRAPEWLVRVLDQFLMSHPDLPGAPAYDDDGNLVTNEPTAAATSVDSPRRRTRPKLPPGQHPGRCEACTRYVPVHDDGFCTECRVHLGLHQPDKRHLVPA
ncbi:hypothetical protein AB0I35_31465 [Nocardia sp. NPDC050378]|uniref:hypothetical protein n=1 Tax=Nocardia sp. NPDC050378 TaxID=3155400 RepID=UPI0033DED6C3